MNIFKEIDEIQHDNNTILTVGTFDGFHLAHRQIINKMISLSKEKNLRSFLITFEPHPQIILRNKTPDIKLLTTLDEKLRLFENAGIENVLVINFTEEFSKTSSREFFEKYIYSGIGISDLVLGYDHLFGHNREGSYETLKELSKEYNFNIHKVDEIDIDGKPVSSTRIRKALAEGNTEEANKLLGYEYSFDGIVVEGDKVGRSIGYPTINMKMLTENKVLPKEGIYCVKLKFNNNIYYGMMYHGFRPTLSEGTIRALEIHIFDFNKTVYGELFTIYFIKRLRDDMKFNTKEELIAQINNDKEQSLKIINSIKDNINN
jgi:riboflavin kinase/FMN adenylyltransferase